ncbi:alpha/beta hydrolase [Haloechinothrix sp. YIM 98757]|uniref:Alpha/beta hydrolase n=1 Tax=Haloechinothrix aidingensis TaxID=2752311 RepID=A0A838A3M0_9PSEU|nr:alpha/beta hydrolase [Haloechinothrix aidingensis]MBA0125883.1 alpha/beta hydrolase [Haloechinothrix aidingensis]
MSGFTLPDGTALHLECQGDPQGSVTVLFAHAYAVDHRCWQDIAGVIPTAVEWPVRVISCDLRGHGSSSRATESTATVEQLADDLAEVIAHAAPDGSVVVVGHGMGGLATLALGQRHPQLFARHAPDQPARVAGIVLLSTGVGDVAAEARAATGLAVEGSRSPPNLLSKVIQDLEVVLGSRLVDLVTDRAHKAAVTAMRWSMFGEDPDPDDVVLTLRMIRAHWPETMALFRPGLDAYIKQAQLDVPEHTQVISMVGERDRLVEPEQASALLGTDRADELIVLPDAGHMLPLERPAQVIPRIVAAVHATHRNQGDAR